MNKNNINEIPISYYIDWKTSNWMKDLFEQNGLYGSIDELELWNSLLDIPKTEAPGRAPSLNDNQNGI
jgi:hypothetical protein